MNLFGWKSAGRAAPHPALSRVYATWVGGQWPRSYEAQLRDLYLTNAVAQRAVRLVAEGIASVSLTASSAKAAALVAATSGGQALLETVASNILLHGNGYVQILRDGDGMPAELFALRPERVTVEADMRGWPLAYRYRAGDVSNLLAADSLIHIRTHHPLDDHYGLGCLDAAAGPMAIHNAAARWNKALLDNAARPSGALIHDGKEALSAQQFDRLRAELADSFQGAGNAGRPMLLEGGLSWQALSLSPAEMDFAALKAGAARDIALAFGVPPMLLGLPGDATYADPARDFQPGEQRADLFEPGQNLVRELPAALDAATAQSWAMSALMAARSRADDLSLSLPWRHLSLVSGESLSVDGAAFAGDWSLAALSLEAMRIEVRLTRPARIPRAVGPADPGRGVPAPDRVHGPTRIVLAELPRLDPGVAQQPLVVVAAAGTAPGWRQANVLQSDASGARWTDIGPTAAPAILGTLVTAPGFAPAGRIDRRNSLTVALLHDEMVLTSCSTDALLAGRNLMLVGGELIQFAEAQRIGPAQYRLSVLLRGQRGTEDQIGSQLPGADVMAIERETLLVLDVPTGGTSIRIMASGVGDASPAEAGIAITGRAVRPLSVVHLSAKQDTAGGMDLTWIRRSRDGWAWPDAIDAPLAEETEQYRITVQPDRGAEVVLDVLTPHATLTPTLLDGLRAAGARRARCFVTQIGSAGTSPPTQIDLDIVNRAAVR